MRECNTPTSDGNDTATDISDPDFSNATTTEGVLTTRPLPYDANSSLMATVLSQDLSLSTASVSVDCCDNQGGRKWIIEFDSGAFVLLEAIHLPLRVEHIPCVSQFALVPRFVQGLDVVLVLRFLFSH